jgi:hypothetical protein
MWPSISLTSIRNSSPRPSRVESPNRHSSTPSAIDEKMAKLVPVPS